jgi:hypothetical protein
MLQNGYWRSVAVQVRSEPENCHDAEFILWAGARVRVQVLVVFVMGAGVSKNHDEPINYTVRVMFRPVLNLSRCTKVS